MIKVAAHVRTIIFPQKDLTAWREAGGTRAALHALIGQLRSGRTAAPPDDDAGGEEAKAVLAELNRDNAVVLVGSQARVLRFEAVPHEAGGERYVCQIPTFLRFNDFRNFHLNRYVNGTDAISIGNWWLAHKDRRQYVGVVLIPGAEPIVDGRLNLWRGFGVEAKRGNWSLLREHIHEVLAARDDDVDLYIVNWLAWGVQHPAEPAEVASFFSAASASAKVRSGRRCVGYSASTPVT